MKQQIFKRMLAVLLGVSMVLPSVPSVSTRAAELQTEEMQKIVFEDVSAMSANGHGAELIKDGNADTFWQSIPSGGEGDAYKINYAHNRYIDITLDGMYDLSQIKVFNRVDGSYNNYYIYASVDGVNYDKIVSKTSNDAATAQGDSYNVDVEASHLRLNMAYNSNTYVTHLSEIEVYGVRTGERADDTTGIQVSDWEGSEWQKEWDKFETDEIYAETKVLTEMKNLVGRVIGEEWQDDFRFELRDSFQDGKDIFEVKDGDDGKIVIAGNNGIALASGFNYYLKNYVNVDYNPLFGSNVQMTGIVPVGDSVVKEAQYNLRYALNFCTYSYTMAFWNWDEYEEFLDWAAMNGLNLILDIVGQEEVLRQTFLEYGFTNEEIKNYICGPAYFAWFYMQNLYSVGGPLPDVWFEQRTELGRKIHDRMQTYGITPVLQGFSGQVPETFPQKNEGAQLAPQDSWPGHTRPALLMTYVSEGQTDYFAQVAETFYEKQKNVFGDISDYYATDPFHEGGRTGSLDVATIYETVQKEMIESNPEAVWILQQWQDGLSDGVKISRLDTSHVLVLDLQSDMRQQNWPFEQKQIPWLYCMLHNFGGRMGLDGEVPVIATDPMETYNNKNYMVGIGITPEALENSPVAYELFLDVLWSKDPIDYHEWIDGYAKRRAGGDSESLQEAWDILVETAYADKSVYYQGAAETVMNARPGDSFKSASTWGHSGIYYDKERLDEALSLLAQNYTAFSNSDAFKYDLADVAEQVICNVAVEYHSRMVAAKNAKDVAEFKKYSEKFLALFDLADQILSTTDEFMLGTWIEAARKMITDADDWTKDLFEFNARSLVTTWGGERPAGNGGLKDYSNRKWSGLTSSFYKERWGIWVRNRLAELEGTAKEATDQKAESNWFMWEYQWTNRKSDDENGKYAFGTTPIELDLGALAKEVYDNYSYSALIREDGVGENVVNALEGKVPTLTGTTSEGTLENIVDGDTGNNWIGTGTGNHILEFNLEGTYQIREFQISIPQLAKNFPYYYKIETWNADADNWDLAAEYSERQLGSNTVVALEESVITDKVRLTMNTTDAVDSPLTITDFAAYGIVVGEDGGYSNITSEATVAITSGTQGSAYRIESLTDGKHNTLWGANNTYPVTVELVYEESVFAHNIEIYFEKAGLPFQFKVSVEDEGGNVIVVSDEYASHTSTLEKVNYQIPVEKMIKKAIVSLVGNTGQGEFKGYWPALAEIEVYGTSYNSKEVQKRIEEIRTTLASLNYDGYTGSYSTQEKAELEEILTQVEEALMDNPDEKTQEALLKQINTAFDKFYKEGKVYINRVELLAALSKAGWMLDGLKDQELQEEKAVVEPAYQSAKEVYDTYRVKQSEVDDAAQALETVVNNYYDIFLDCKFVNKLAEAKEVSEKVLVYTAETLDDLKGVIAETELAEGAEAKEAAYRKLQNAIKRLEKILCVEITWKSNLISKGVVAGSGEYAVEDKILLSAEPVEGYRFVGWYMGNQQISQESTCEYVVLDADINTKINFVAKYEVLVEVSWKSKPISGGVTAGSGYYAPGEQVEVTATEIEGAKFIGWYVGNEEITKELSCEYTVKEKDRKVELVAKYEALTLVDVSDNEVYVGETVMLMAPADVAIEVSKEGIVRIDRDTMTIAAIGAGEVELTFKRGDDVLGTETIVVSDGDIVQMPRDDMKQLTLSVTSNTEEPTGEGAGNGIDDAIIDGNSGTFWHSEWSASNFVVSESNPAWIEVDLGEELEIPGFVFRQRNGANGRIQKYSYEAKNAAGQVVASEDGIVLSSQEQTAGTIVTVKFANDLKVKTVKVKVLQGTNGNACMAEFVLLMKKKVATSGQVTLDDVNLSKGEKIKLEPVCEKNTFVKGLVWSSSNEEVATVNENGVVTGHTVGTATITARNAAGVEVSCEVRVDSASEEPEGPEEPDEPIALEVYAVTNITETLKEITLPEGLKWVDETIGLGAFAGHNEKVFTAEDTDGKLKEVIVRLSTIQNLSVTSDTGVNKAVKVATGEKVSLDVTYEVLGAKLPEDFEVKVTAKAEKDDLVNVSTVENSSEVLLEAVKAGTTNVVVEIKHADQVIASYKQKVTIADSSSKGVAEVNVVLCDKDGKEVSVNENGVYVVEKGAQVSLKDNTEAMDGKSFKVSYKSSDVNVVKTGKTTDKITKLDLKTAGFAVITATAKDTTGSTCRIPVKVVDHSETGIVLSQTAVTVNKALKDAKAELKVYNGFGGKLTAVAFNGKEITSFTEEGTIYLTENERGKGLLKVTVSDENTVVSKEFKDITVKETNNAPKVTIKQIRNLNAQYKEGYAQFMIGADGAVIEGVTVNGLGDYCSYDKESNILTLRDVTDGAKKENFVISFDDYKDVPKQVSVKQDKENFKLSAASSTVYSGLSERMEVQLLNKKTSVAEVNFDVTVDNDNYTVKNDKGVVVIEVREERTATNNDKLTLTFSNDDVWREDIIQTFKVKVVSKEKAALQLGSKSVTLYNYKDYGVISQVSTPLTLKGGSSLVLLDDEQVVIEGSVTNKLDAEYENGRILVTAKEELTQGTYNLQVKAGNLNPVTLKVKVIDVKKADTKTEASATVKKSGNIDVLNRDGSSIVLKGSFKNVAKDAKITDVHLTGRDAYLFEIVGVSGANVTVQLKDNVAVITKYAYKVGVEYTIDCPGENELVLRSKTVDVKLNQKKPKVKVEGSGVYSNAKDESAEMKVVLYNSAGVKVDAQKVKLLNFTKDFKYDMEKGSLIHKATGETAIGKTYSLKFEVVAKEAAENEKPVTVVYKVKVVK